MIDDDPETFEEWSAHLQRDYESGNRAALLLMIHFCCVREKPIPDWASRTFQDVYTDTLGGGARSWDDVFGEPHPKQPGKRGGAHLYTKQIENRRYEVYARIIKLKKEGAAINNELFEKVGRELGVGGYSNTKRLYSRAKRVMDKIEGRKK